MQEDVSNKDRFWRLANLSGVASKEKPETWEALSKFRSYIKSGSSVAEIGAGHGLLGTWLSWMGICKTELYDVRYLEKLPIGYKTALAFKPYLKELIKINSRKLTFGDEGIEADCIIGVHACGDLTDYALRAAVKKKIPVAIMTCCHGKKVTNTPRCVSNINLTGIGIDGSAGTDIGRACWLLEQGYKVKMNKIRSGITGEPRMIFGEYNTHN